MNLLDRIRSRQAIVVVAGLGRVGLPLAVVFARAGLRVMGIETDRTRRQYIELGKMPFHEPGCEQALLDMVTAGRLTVYGGAEVASQADVIILAVGTPLAADLRPDYVQLQDVLSGLAPHLHPGQLIVQRSTVSPGTLERVLLPHLRRLVPEVSDHLLLAACPERIAEGKAMQELMTLPEIVGGIDERSTEAAAELFRLLSPDKRIHLTDPTSAELAKLFTNVYRYVNFALANEFGILSEYYQVDVHNILEMVNRDYARANVPGPGPAGGPCLSKDGYFLVEELTLPDFVLIAWKLNDTMPAYMVRRLARRLARHGVDLPGVPVGVLGKSFKRDSDDLRESPAMRIIQLLSKEGAIVRAHDPFVPAPTLEETLVGARAVVVATNHSFYETLDPHEVRDLMREPWIVFDCWGMLDHQRFTAAGLELVTFGVGEEL